MKLFVLTLVLQEGSRWLPSLLHQWTTYADGIIALDDGSTDDTVGILEAAGAVVHRRGGPAAWGAEAGARAELYRLGVASDADWLLWLDADMGFTRSPRGIVEAADAAGADAVAFRLYDLWENDGGNLRYREDAYWRAHQVPRVWCVRNPGGSEGVLWPERGLHCGHLPSAGLRLRRIVTAPRDISLVHYAYSRQNEREWKYESYMRKRRQLTPAEIAHAETIVDAAPRLLPLEGCEYKVSYGR